MTPPTLLAGSTHLFRGARLHGAPLPEEPAAVRIRFSDGVEVQAELVEETGSGAFGLELPAYDTAAGTSIPPKLWRIAHRETTGEIVIGDRVG